MERKFAQDAEFKVNDDRIVSGYASVFNQIDLIGDTVKPGAFREAIEQIKSRKGVQMLLNHSPVVIGRWTDVVEDQKGLRVSGQLTPGHSKAEDAYASIKAGHMAGLSIGFKARDFLRRPDGGRDLKSVGVFEISVVGDPMDRFALLDEVKAADMQPREFREFMRKAMRDAGCELSQREADALVGGGYKSLIAMRDAGGTVETKGVQDALLDAIRLARS